tara:strand:+ start:562 stop:843 length:282 start_codon:yes stop_codon:yes gene_type:complete
MSDSIKKWHEMNEKVNRVNAEHYPEFYKPAKYIFLLDFIDGKVYRYDISLLCTKENEWNPDTESCEAFLYGAGHKVNNCEWMVTDSKNIEYGN